VAQESLEQLTELMMEQGTLTKLVAQERLEELMELMMELGRLTKRVEQVKLTKLLMLKKLKVLEEPVRRITFLELLV